MMSEHILDFCWLTFFYNKDPYNNMFSHSIFLGCELISIYVIFHTFKNVTNLSQLRQMCEFFYKLELVPARPKNSTFKSALVSTIFFN